MTPFGDGDRRARAGAMLRLGLPVLLRDPQGASHAALAAERVTGDALQAFRGLAAPCLVISAFRARTLRVRRYDGDLARIPLTPAMTAAGVAALADPSRDLETPLKGPFTALRGTDADPARGALALVREAGLLPALLLGGAGEPVAGVFDDAVVVALEAALESPGAAAVSLISSVWMPLPGAEQSRVHLFRELRSGDEHFALEVGAPAREDAPLVRVHSSCYTGDVLGSLRCDCGPQLQQALADMKAAGGGVLITLQQEGRGIGLANKLRAYALQDQGFDTYEANCRLGFEEDARDFAAAGGMLRALGFHQLRMLSDNPAKREALEASGIKVIEARAHVVGENPHNARYLATKHRFRHG